MSDVLVSPPAPGLIEAGVSRASGERRDRRGVSLPQLLAGYRGVLCAIAPDAAGRQIVERVGAAIGGRDCRLGVASTVPFDLPLDASACIFPTPLDRRARLIVERQRTLDDLVRELALPHAEVFALAGDPAGEIRALARLWRADVVLFARSAGTGMRNRRGRRGGFDAVGLDDHGGVAPATLAERLMGA